MWSFFFKSLLYKRFSIDLRQICIYWLVFFFFFIRIRHVLCWCDHDVL